MRALLSVVGLLITLAIVFWLVKGQIGGSSDFKVTTDTARPAQIKEQVANEVKKAMEDQTKKVEEADKDRKSVV